MNAPAKLTKGTMNIAQRINAAMAEVDYVQKQKPKDQGMKYTYVSHDAVTAKVRPILQGHGVVYYPRDLTVTQSGNRTEAVFNVRFENMDDRSDFIDVATLGYGVDNQDKGPGKAISYGVKYALLKVLGLETGDDPEEIQDERADHKPDAGMIDDGQWATLTQMIEATGADTKAFCAYLKVPSLKQMPQSKYDAAFAALQAKADKQKEPA